MPVIVVLLPLFVGVIHCGSLAFERLVVPLNLLLLLEHLSLDHADVEIYYGYEPLYLSNYPTLV
jgi:hypothetical protein